MAGAARTAHPGRNSLYEAARRIPHPPLDRQAGGGHGAGAQPGRRGAGGGRDPPPCERRALGGRGRPAGGGRRLDQRP